MTSELILHSFQINAQQSVTPTINPDPIFVGVFVHLSFV